MATVIGPSFTQRVSVRVKDLTKGDIITNVGIVDAINFVGVFVVAKVRGTVWSLADGIGDIGYQDVVWHASQWTTIDRR